MARVNCDPYTGVHLFALVNRVTGLVDTEPEVDATVKALEAVGVPSDDIAIFTGEQGAKCLDLFGREHGRAVRLLRTLEAAVGHEGETNHRIDNELRNGASLICVKVHKRTDEKPRVIAVLQQLHAHEIHYWGTWGHEDMPSSPAACGFCALPTERILGENEHAVWILDLHPVSPGHSLIVSKRHVESFFESPSDEREGLLSLLDRAKEQVARNHKPSGFNIGINEGVSAGQMVKHLHVHLIPRFSAERENGKPRGGMRWVIPDKAEHWAKR